MTSPLPGARAVTSRRPIIVGHENATHPFLRDSAERQHQLLIDEECGLELDRGKGTSYICSIAASAVCFRNLRVNERDDKISHIGEVLQLQKG